MSEFLKTQKQLNKRVLPPQERPRNWKGFFPQNKACCPGIKHSYKNYYLVINELCENYNMLHATKTRFCSIGTSQSRRNFYRLFFKKVCKHFKVDPRDLKPKHIEWYFTNYIKDWLQEKQSVQGVKRHLENCVAQLMFFSRMIGKFGIVKKASYYLELVDPEINFNTPQNYRSQGMSEEKVHEILNRAFEHEILLGCQLLAMFAFGLRDREACGLRPCEDFSDKEEGGELRRYLTIRPKAGSKGGRPRAIPFTNDLQYEAEALLVSICKAQGWQELKKPDHSLAKATRHLRTLASNKSIGFVASSIGSTPYAFRHSFAEKYFAKAGKDGLNQEDSLKSTSLALGHYREHITGVYLNSLFRAGNEAMGKLFDTLLFTEPGSLDAVKIIPLIVREMLFFDMKLGLEMACIFADPDTGLGKNPVLGIMLDIVLKDKDVARSKEIVVGIAGKFQIDPKTVEEVICCHGGSIDLKEIYRVGVEPHLAKIMV